MGRKESNQTIKQTGYQYINERLILFEEVRDFQPLNNKLLLLGHDTLNNTNTIRGLFKYECKWLQNFLHIYATTKW